MLKTLLSANATQANPIIGLAIKGVGFRDTMPTYMDPHGVPSAGDWALERMGMSPQACNVPVVSSPGASCRFPGPAALAAARACAPCQPRANAFGCLCLLYAALLCSAAGAVYIEGTTGLTIDG